MVDGDKGVGSPSSARSDWLEIARREALQPQLVHRLVQLREAPLIRRQYVRRERRLALAHPRPADRHRRAAVADRSGFFVAVSIASSTLGRNA